MISYVRLWFVSLFHRAPVYDYKHNRFVFNPIRKYIINVYFDKKRRTK
jgi:hypothetical protein